MGTAVLRYHDPFAHIDSFGSRTPPPPMMKPRRKPLKSGAKSPPLARSPVSLPLPVRSSRSSPAPSRSTAAGRRVTFSDKENGAGNTLVARYPTRDLVMEKVKILKRGEAPALPAENRRFDGVSVLDSLPVADSRSASVPSSPPTAGSRSASVPASPPTAGSRSPSVPASPPTADSRSASVPASSPAAGSRSASVPASSPVTGSRSASVPASSPVAESRSASLPASPPTAGSRSASVSASSPVAGSRSVSASASPAVAGHRSVSVSDSKPAAVRRSTNTSVSVTVSDPSPVAVPRSGAGEALESVSASPLFSTNRLGPDPEILPKQIGFSDPRSALTFPAVPLTSSKNVVSVDDAISPLLSKSMSKMIGFSTPPVGKKMSRKARFRSSLPVAYAGPGYINSPAPSAVPFPASFMSNKVVTDYDAVQATRSLRGMLNLGE